MCAPEELIQYREVSWRISYMTTFDQLKKVSRTFPNSPGVYFWRNKQGAPLYIGRAGSLKKRIANYFLAKRDPRIFEMTQMAHSLDFETTETLLEAIVLEANLIKQYWPKYNVQEKDNKSFIYMVVTDEPFPRILMVRGRELERYETGNVKTLAIFGPYQSYYLLRKALEIIRKIFPYSNCRPGQLKPCFHNQIGLCPGVCVGAIDAKTYRESIRNIILFFRGDKKALLKRLQKENSSTSGGLDKIKALKQVRDTALLADSDVLLRGNQLTDRRIEGYDISHSGGKNPVGAMVVFENGEADPSQYRLFNIRGLSVIASTRSNPVDGSRVVARDDKGDRLLRVLATTAGKNQDDLAMLEDPPSLKLRKGKGFESYDDLAMLEEILTRRLLHSEWALPQIVFVDGGTNQVKRVDAVLKKHGHILPVVGLSKAGKHAASSAGGDKFVVANGGKVGKELILASRNLFQQVRNEAHRFSISAQRKRAKKGFLR
jgi:excinuclease UvrABC nuclease subunit